MNIWIPKRKIIEPNRELLVPAAQLCGFYKFEAVRPDGRRRLLADWFPNLILDQGLDRIGTAQDWLNACRVGTGNTAPANSDTNLVTHLAGTNTQQAVSSGVTGSAPYYGYYQKTYRFAQGAAAGNLTEVGVGWATTSGSNLFSRALILDGGGSPTTLTVLSDEFLDVTYELRAYSPSVDGSGTISISASSYDYTSRAAQANSTLWTPTPFTGGRSSAGGSGCTAYSGAIGAVTSTPSGTTGNANNDVNSAYSNSNYYRDFTASWGLNDGNVGGGGILSILVRYGCGEMQFQFNPAIAKTSSKLLDMVFRHTWARKTLP